MSLVEEVGVTVLVPLSPYSGSWKGIVNTGRFLEFQMLSAKDTYSESIKDAENLLAHFDELNSHPPPEELEVLKRAGLIMGMTAWETYVEDCVYELTTARLSELADENAARFIDGKLEDELERFHNPDTSKTIALFRDFAGIDLSETWCFNNFDHAAGIFFDALRRHGIGVQISPQLGPMAIARHFLVSASQTTVKRQG